MTTPKGHSTKKPAEKGLGGEAFAPSNKPSLKLSAAAKPKRLIKVSRTSSALRQHVASVKDEPDFTLERRNAPPLIQIKRLALPAKIQKRSGPSPELRRLVEKTKAAARRSLARSPRPDAEFATVRGPSSTVAKTRAAARASLDDPADLGALVRNQRRQMKLNQGELATLSGVGRRFIVELEAGKSTIEFGKALKVCAALSLSLIAESHDHE